MHDEKKNLLKMRSRVDASRAALKCCKRFSKTSRLRDQISSLFPKNVAKTLFFIKFFQINLLCFPEVWGDLECLRTSKI